MRSQPEQLLHRHVQPLAVEADLEALGVEHLERLLLERLRVRVDLGRREDGPRRGAPARVAHPRRVVADDQHHDVAEILELAELLEDDREAEVDVGRGGVDAQLDAERPAELQLPLEPPVGQAIDGVPSEPGGLFTRPGAGRRRRREQLRRGLGIHPGQC